MPDGVNVHSIRALDELRTALQQFSRASADALAAAGREIQVMDEWLLTMRRQWQGEVQRRQEEFRVAERRLIACREAADDRSGGGCAGYETALLRARVELARATDGLQNVEFWIKTLRQAAQSYGVEAQRLTAELEQRLPRGLEVLRSSASRLQAYAAISLAAASGPVRAVPTTPVSLSGNPETSGAREVSPTPERLQGGLGSPERRG